MMYVNLLTEFFLIESVLFQSFMSIQNTKLQKIANCISKLFFPLQFRTPSTFYPSDFNYFIIWVSPLTE